MKRKPAQASIDASFTTAQRDMFESGLVAEIGANAFAVWMALKHHADFNTGKSFPGVRRIAELVGLNKDTVTRCVRSLEEARLLRTAPRGRGRSYIARERLDVRIGNAVVASVLVDYVPARVREKLIGIEQALDGGKGFSDEAFAEDEIVPGPGFTWDPESRSLKGRVPSALLAPAEPTSRMPQQLKDLLADMRKK